MLKNLFHTAFVLAIMLVSCTGRGVSGVEPATLSVQGSAACCEDSAMAHFIQQPERAICLLDSAVMLQRITPQRAQYLKAIVTYNGLNRPDSCIAICQKMLDDEAWKELPDEDAQIEFQVEVYELMATAAYTLSDLLAIQRYCNAGIQLAHGRKDLQSDEADMLSRMGARSDFPGRDLDSRLRRLAFNTSVQLQFTLRRHFFISAEVGMSGTFGHLYQRTTRNHWIYSRDPEYGYLYLGDVVEAFPTETRINRVSHMGQFVDFSIGVGWNVGRNQNDRIRKRR